MDQDVLVQLFGKLHPMLLHMPIGLWFGVVALEFGGALLSRFGRREQPQDLVQVPNAVPAVEQAQAATERRAPNRATLATLAWMAALLGAAAAGSGWVLGTSGYKGETIELHRWLGVGAGAIGLFTAVFAAMKNREPFRLMLVVQFTVLMAAGHFGSELTHGKDWLLEPFQPKSDAKADEPAPTTDAIAPAAQNVEPERKPEAEAAKPAVPHDPMPLFPPVEELPTSVRTNSVAPTAKTPADAAPAAQPVQQETQPAQRDAQPAKQVTPPEQQQERPAPQPSSSTTVSFRAQIEPILKTYCVSCHGPAKKKGGLRLHEPSAIEEGGENGAVLTKGKPADSPMYAFVALPLYDDQHMPPERQKQPTAAEIALLRTWIEQGATFDGTDAAPNATEPQAPSENAQPQQPSQPAPAKEHAHGEASLKASSAPSLPPSPWTEGADAAVRALHDRQVHAARIAQGSDDLWIDFGAIATTTTDEQIAQWLTPLQPWIADLSVARTGASKATLAACAAMPRLRRLDLRSTKIAAEDLQPLRTHATLEELVLADTAVDDACLDVLLTLPKLSKVFVWNTKIGERGIARLCLRQGLRVDDGTSLPAAKTEAPEAPAKPDAAGTTALKPRNTTCPVSGSPVDPRFSVLHEGRAIGFCCPNCPKTFWLEPAKYPVADR